MNALLRVRDIAPRSGGLFPTCRPFGENSPGDPTRVRASASQRAVVERKTRTKSFLEDATFITWILFRRCCSAVFIIPSYFSQPHVLPCPIHGARPLLLPAQLSLASQKNRAARFGVSRRVFIFTASTNAVPVTRPRKPKELVTARVRVPANSRRAADRP
jgi:hypothetical protein